MSTAVMRKVEILLMHGDLYPAMEGIGREACFEPAPPSSPGRRYGQNDRKPTGPQTAAKTELGPAEKLHRIRQTLGLDYPEKFPETAALPDSEAYARLEALHLRVADFETERKGNEEQVARTRQALEEARAFAGLKLPFGELGHLSFLALRIGHVEASEIPALRSSLGERALILPVDRGGLIVAVGTRKGRFALDTELGRFGFKPQAFPQDYRGIPDWLPERLEVELDALSSRSFELEQRRSALARELESDWQALAASFEVLAALTRLREGSESSGQVTRLVGWIPRERLATAAMVLRRSTGGRFALRAWAPREIESVRRGEEEIPVLLKPPRIASGFARLVLSYGTPPYGTVDPTVFAALFFTLMFSIMFGDLGQGALILGAGIFLRSRFHRPFARWQGFAPIVIGAGCGSMLMGLLTGCCFANDTWLMPLERFLTQHLLGQPKDRFLALMPDAGAGNILAFFGFALALGVVVNTAGLVINMLDRYRMGKWGEALFSKTGLCGALFFLWAVGMGVRLLLGHRLAWFDGLGLGLPLALLACSEPLSDLVTHRRREEKEGVFTTLVRGFVAVLESTSYFVANSLSFLRVAAFALSHVVLSFIIFQMGDLLRERAWAGIVWEILVVVAGNAIILVLEGMIVVVQIIRLEYYEFLSKFLTETGRPFAPLRFEYGKE